MKRTPLYAVHVKLSAKIVPFSGFEMPLSYSGVTDEHHTVRNAVGLFDISHMGRFEVEGESAVGYLEHVSTVAVHKIIPEGAQYSLILNSQGGILDDIYLYRRRNNAFTIIVNAANREKDFSWLKTHLPPTGVALKDKSEETALLALQGPRSVEVLSKVRPPAEKEIPLRHFIETDIPSVQGCRALIARTGYTGEKGFELLFPAKYAVSLWDAIMEAGKPLGIKPIGLGARDTLRLEKGYMLYGHDIDETTTPVEAGLLPFVDLEKEFLGKQAVLRASQEGGRRRLIGFELLAGGVPRETHLLYSNGREIGKVTSGNFSPSLRKGIGIGYVDAEFAGEGTEISVDIRGKKIPAVVVKRPFYRKKR